MSRLRDLYDGRAEATEAREWICASCDKYTEHEGQRHCRLCKMYWDDVANGLFEL